MRKPKRRSVPGRKSSSSPGSKRRTTLPGSFLPVFWSPVWFPTQIPNTSGMLCDPTHPLFAQFPTEFHTNWQWYDLLYHSRAMILDDTPAAFRPLVQVIDNFARNHKLGSVFETRVGRGRLLVCAIDLSPELQQRPAVRQFVRSLYAYLDSDAFKPADELGMTVLDDLLAAPPPSVLSRLGAGRQRRQRRPADIPAAAAIDDDPDTFWHTAWTPTEKPFPHEIVIDLGREIRLAGVSYLPRQDMSNGRIADYEIYASGNATSWGAPVASGRW